VAVEMEERGKIEKFAEKKRLQEEAEMAKKAAVEAAQK